MEGFLNIRLSPWLRRLITRLIAIVPAVIVTAIYGEQGATDFIGVKSGYSLAAAFICCHSACEIHIGSYENGRTCCSEMDGRLKLVCSHRYCCLKCLFTLFNFLRLVFRHCNFSVCHRQAVLFCHQACSHLALFLGRK